MDEFNAARGFAGDSPGQDLRSVIVKLTSKDLRTLIGPRLLPLLPNGGAQRHELEMAALQVLRDKPLELFGQQSTRATLLRNLDTGKLEELRFRLGAGSISAKERDIPDLGKSTNWPIVARFFGLDVGDTAQAPSALPREEIGPAFPLFPHQRSVVRRTYSQIGSGHGRTLIHMPTGSGKTRTAMHLISRILNEHEPCVVVWLAASQELLEQAAETFAVAWRALGNRQISLIRFWGDYTEAPTQVCDGLLIAGLGKLHAWRERHSADFLRLGAKCRLVVMDEAHQSIAPTYRALIDGLCSAGMQHALVGLTATPGRTWNDIPSDQALSDYFGANKVVLEVGDDPNPVKYLLNEGYLAKPVFRQINYSPGVMPTARELRALGSSQEYLDESLEKLASDVARNLAIISGVLELIENGHRRIILFAVGVQHAADLTIALAARGIRAELVTGETPSAKRSAVLKDFKRPSEIPMVLCNFGVLTTGFDAPQTSAAVIARPTKSLVLYSQMVGRATRGVRAGGNESCEILTVHDPAYPGFGDIAEAFFNWEDVWSNRNE